MTGIMIWIRDHNRTSMDNDPFSVYHDLISVDPGPVGGNHDQASGNPDPTNKDVDPVRGGNLDPANALFYLVLLWYF